MDKSLKMSLMLYIYWFPGLVSEPQSKVEENRARGFRTRSREGAAERWHHSISQHQLSVSGGPRQETERTSGVTAEVKEDRHRNVVKTAGDLYWKFIRIGISDGPSLYSFSQFFKVLFWICLCTYVMGLVFATTWSTVNNISPIMDNKLCLDVK